MRRKLIAVVILIFILLLVGLIYADTFSWDRLVEHEATLRRAVDQRPVASVGIGLVVYVIASLIPGTTGKSVLFGWLFGFWVGILIVGCSLTLAATISFLTARYLLSDWLQRSRLSRLIRRVDETIEREGAYYLVALRLLHVPYSLLNYSAGATRISTTTFVWTTFVGILPSSIAMVLAGSQLPTLADVTRVGVWSVVDFRVLLAMSAAAMIPFIARKIARVIRNQTAPAGQRARTDSFSVERGIACAERSSKR
jgi:uncharacterized membrane protein YdjX (TVP38/TMEM64 family)